MTAAFKAYFVALNLLSWWVLAATSKSRVGLAYSGPTAPAPGVGVYEKLRALANQALHHGWRVVGPMLWDERLGDFV